MTPRALRVRTAVRGVFWTAALFAIYLALHIIPEAAANLIIGAFQ